MKLVFTDSGDVSDVWGALRFGGESLHPVAETVGLPPARWRCAAPDRGGGYWLYGTAPVKGPQSIIRAHTDDGIHFGDTKVLRRDDSSLRWMGDADIACDPRSGRMISLMFARGEPWHQAWAFGCTRGGRWRKLSRRPAYQDQDALGLTWDPLKRLFLCAQTTYQPIAKRYPDNIGGEARRVLHILTSHDGVDWGHDVPVNLRGGPYVPQSRIITPDDQDPPEMEFYRLTPFAWCGRFAGMMLNYAPSPQVANPHAPASLHGPQLSTEWWVSRDGVRWQRPCRESSAAGEAPTAIMHEPMTIGGQHLWVIGGRVYGLMQHRIFFAGALANAEFSTEPFTVPSRPLALDAELGFRHTGSRQFPEQGYIMVALMDPAGRVIRGYEPQRCLLRPTGDRPIVLNWRGRTSTRLAGKVVRARLFLRDARIYSLAESAAEGHAAG